MSNRRDLLIEIGTEELPPKALTELSEEFSRGVFNELLRHALIDGNPDAEGHEVAASPFATPRRLAVLIKDVITKQADSGEVRIGPLLSAARDDQGNWTKAALGFARSCGAEVDSLEIQQSDKGERLACSIRKEGRAAADLLPEIVERVLAGLPIPKRMRWGSSSAEFVRPVHWVVILLGDQVIPAKILGVLSGNVTRGHRFHHPGPIIVTEPTAYEALLEQPGYVIARRDRRRAIIKEGALQAASKLDGQAVIKESLLDEVTALVEWPVVFSGKFDARFLDVPTEALVSSMQVHQKCFPVIDGDGNLMPYFIAVSNIESKDMDEVRTGNERVMQPRLADAAFFWNQDRKIPLAQRLQGLKGVVFQQQLGSLSDKSQRVSLLAGVIAKRLGSRQDHAQRAGLLAKCDLATEMVGEFPELQGIMGRYYAHHDGEPDEVCCAIDEQYMPRFAGDKLPETVAGQAVAIADKLDTLVGIFGIGQVPSGNKDPYALRRAALGVLRILIERDLDLDLIDLLHSSAVSYGETIDKDTIKQVFDFMMERLRAYYTDNGIPYDSVEAVLACSPREPRDFDKRVRAVTEFRGFPESESLAAANKRIRNILKKADQQIPDQIDATALSEHAEQQLAGQLSRFRREVEPLFEAGDYTPALTKLTGLREPVDRFFDNVMVMTEDSKLRSNRLAILSQLSALFLRVADISRLER